MVDREHKLLMAEGKDDLYTIAEFMGQFLEWPHDKHSAPVTIKDMGGVEHILKAHTIPLQLKSQKVQILGIVIDADSEFDTRWNRLRTICAPYCDDLPETIPDSGLIAQTKWGKRLGIWIMPNNRAPGMLETFLAAAIPADQATIWMMARDATEAARAAGAPFIASHREKANLHTWLAWQNPPGESLGHAVMRKALQTANPDGTRFAAWFRKLFEI